jgi:hypothetical protein
MKRKFTVYTIWYSVGTRAFSFGLRYHHVHGGRIQRVAPCGRFWGKGKCRPPEMVNSFWGERDTFPRAPNLTSLVSSAH